MTVASSHQPPPLNDKLASYDLKQAVDDNRLAGLWRLISGFHWTFIGATVALGFAALAKTLVYFVFRDFVDNTLGQPERANLVPLIALSFIGLALLEGGFTFLSGRWAARTAEGTAYRLRNYLFDQIQRLPFAYHDRTATGELIQRSTSDVDHIRRFLADQATAVGRVAMLFIVNFIAILLLNWQLALFSVIVVPLVLLISLWFFRRISKAYEAYQEQEATLSTTLQENLTGVRVVRAFARQDYEREKFEKDNWEKYRRGRWLLINHSLYWPTTDIISGLQMLAGFTFAALLAIDGTISVGTYLAYHQLVIWIIWPMRNLGRLIVEMSTGLVSYQRVAKVIAEEREPLDEGEVRPDGPPQGHIVYNNVAFAYQPPPADDADAAKTGKEAAPQRNGADPAAQAEPDAHTPHVLRDISFECRPGQVIALMGGAGSGKTSLVNLLPRFYEATGGAITLDGQPLSSYPRRYLRQQIGIVEQEPFLFSRTIRENITYGVGRAVTDDEVYAAARAAAIHDGILSFPDGYSTLVGEKGVTLSGGQKQRVAIARTLLKNPRILILDDATSSVDSETEAEIHQALQRLMENRTTFVIAHRIQSVMDADLILVLKDGHVLQHGAHDELMAQPGFYRQIYDLQARMENELQREIAGNGTEG
ncbi:MAG: ABC transporter ATP-binding protein [Anaerolineae bacterium]